MTFLYPNGDKQQQTIKSSFKAVNLNSRESLLVKLDINFNEFLY
jgi:hypothetical protein